MIQQEILFSCWCQLTFSSWRPWRPSTTDRHQFRSDTSTSLSSWTIVHRANAARREQLLFRLWQNIRIIGQTVQHLHENLPRDFPEKPWVDQSCSFRRKCLRWRQFCSLSPPRKSVVLHEGIQQKEQVFITCKRGSFVKYLSVSFNTHPSASHHQPFDSLCVRFNCSAKKWRLTHINLPCPLFFLKIVSLTCNSMRLSWEELQCDLDSMSTHRWSLYSNSFMSVESNWMCCWTFPVSRLTPGLK